MTITDRSVTHAEIPPELPGVEPPVGGDPRRRRWLVVLAMIGAAIALVGGALLVTSEGDEESEQPPTTLAPATSGAQTSTEAPATTAAPPTTVPVDLTTAVFPSGPSAVTFEDPVAAARGFAIDFVGFVNPIVGEFQAGDSQSGEVEVRPSADGPVTTVGAPPRRLVVGVRICHGEHRCA